MRDCSLRMNSVVVTAAETNWSLCSSFSLTAQLHLTLQYLSLWLIPIVHLPEDLIVVIENIRSFDVPSTDTAVIDLNEQCFVNKQWESTILKFTKTYYSVSVGPKLGFETLYRLNRSVDTTVYLESRTVQKYPFQI
jgi:hypothetical protein